MGPIVADFCPKMDIGINSVSIRRAEWMEAPLTESASGPPTLRPMIIVLTLIADSPELSVHPNEEAAVDHLAGVVGRSWTSKLLDEPIPLDPLERVQRFFAADERDLYWFLRPESANQLPEASIEAEWTGPQNGDSQ